MGKKEQAWGYARLPAWNDSFLIVSTLPIPKGIEYSLIF